MKKMLQNYRSKEILANFSQTYDLNSPLQMEQRSTSCCTKEAVKFNNRNYDDNEMASSAIMSVNAMISLSPLALE
jgi:hypothetical protein